jgi:nucleoside-triphosphatase THEP1
MENYSRAVLLTGRRGVGKTTVCQAVAELARHRGYRPGGVITPALSNSHGVKVGFEAVDVGSGERWPLARTDLELGGPRVGPYRLDPTGLARALRVLRRASYAGCDLFMVDEIGPLELEQGEGFAPILDLLRSSLRTWGRPGTTPEKGALSQRESSYWRCSRTVRMGSPEPCSAPAKRETSFATPEENSSEDLLPCERPTHTLIVVRPAFLDQLLLRLRETSFATSSKIFSVTEGNRDELPLRIVEALWGDQHHCSVR